jgi:hypothetical protein
LKEEPGRKNPQVVEEDSGLPQTLEIMSATGKQIFSVPNVIPFTQIITGRMSFIKNMRTEVTPVMALLIGHLALPVI